MEGTKVHQTSTFESSFVTAKAPQRVFKPALLRNRSFLAVAVLLTCTSSAARAETAVINPLKDNTLIESATGTLSNGTGPLFAGLTGGRGPGELRSILAFDIAAEIPAGAIITDVQLNLTVTMAGGGSGSDTFGLHRVLQDWGEGDSFANGGGGQSATTGDATWVHTFSDTDTWNTPGGDFDPTASALSILAGPGAATWSTTAELVTDVQGWLDDSDSNFGWILISNSTQPASARQFGSRESTTSPPQLTITYTPVIPEPSSWVLGLLGAMFASARRARGASASRQ